jgi:homoserine dehydrogenase
MTLLVPQAASERIHERTSNPWASLERRERAAREKQRKRLRAALTDFAQAITEDVSTFEAMMGRLGLPINPIKSGLAVITANRQAEAQRFAALLLAAERICRDVGIEGKAVVVDAGRSR